MNTDFFGDSFLKDGFKHVYAIERQALGWLCSDPSKSDIHTHILPAHYDAEVMEEFKRRHPTFTILALKVKPHSKSIFPSLGVISCVSIMQYMLGVHWPFVFTPYQLYNKIKKGAAIHIEVIECQDTKSMQHNGKRQPPQDKPTSYAANFKRNLGLIKNSLTKKS